MKYQLPNNSIVAVHDIFDPLPEWMNRADTLFVDIPYNQSLLTNFIYRDGVEQSRDNTGNFNDFLDRLFECVSEIAPQFVFIEVGKEYLAECFTRLQDLYKYVTFYNSTYYNRGENKCYVIHATNQYRRRRYKELEDMDEAKIIEWLCQNHEFECIGDLCMGEGLVGINAFKAGKSFVGTEINPDRLIKLVERVKCMDRT